MAQEITSKDYLNMLKGAVEQIRQNYNHLSQLDAATGDGDHGETILKVMNNLYAALIENENEPLDTCIFQSGMAAASTDGGSSAPLIGSFFIGMSEPAEGKTTLTAKDVAAMIAGGICAVKEDSKAQIGDKTMMDALLPVLAYVQSVQTDDVQILMKTCAKIALEGAEETKKFIAKFGRARNLGERVIGHADAGAFSISFIFKGMSEAI